MKYLIILMAVVSFNAVATTATMQCKPSDGRKGYMFTKISPKEIYIGNGSDPDHYIQFIYGDKSIVSTVKPLIVKRDMVQKINIEGEIKQTHSHWDKHVSVSLVNAHSRDYDYVLRISGVEVRTRDFSTNQKIYEVDTRKAFNTAYYCKDILVTQ